MHLQVHFAPTCPTWVSSTSGIGTHLRESCTQEGLKKVAFLIRVCCNVCCCVLQFATEAAITILRIDDMIQLEPEREEEMED
jgi:hypothetical protein